MTGRLPLAEPSFGEAEAEAVAEVVRSRWLTMGPRTAEFEEAFAESIGGASYAAMASSCTAALHLAYAALGLGPGDEVIVPSLTFVATANAVAYTGAEPRFADISSLDSPLLDPAHVEALIGPRTAAVCAVHYAGYPADMKRLRSICDRKGLALIEDAAHSPGAMDEDGRMAGALGDVACFSFFSNKNLVTGEGGMVTTQDEDLMRRVRRMRAHGLERLGHERKPGGPIYDIVERGFNYRPSELEAAIGLIQLGKLPGLAARRRELVGRYRRLLQGHADLGFVPFAGRDTRSSCHILPLVVREGIDTDAMRRSASEQGIETSMHYPPVHRFTAYDEGQSLATTEEFARREITLPLFPDMADLDVDRTVTTLCSPVGARA